MTNSEQNIWLDLGREMTEDDFELTRKWGPSFPKLPYAEVAGWVGLCLIHGATLPVTLRAIFTGSADFPPLSMVLMIWAGLGLFLIRACAQRDLLYIVSNAVGFALQTALLSLIVFGG